MAKLNFRYGAMNSGKTTILIQTAYNYEERGQHVIVIKPSKDTKGASKIVSRIGAEREVNELIAPDDSVYMKCKKYFDDLSCILVDEAQFLTSDQVEELFYITKKLNIPVIAFGLRNDYMGASFEGSKRLWELADEFVEMPTICRCGKKARFNPLWIDGILQTTGETNVVIDNNKSVRYESMCGECFLKNVLESGIQKKIEYKSRGKKE